MALFLSKVLAQLAYPLGMFVLVAASSLIFMAAGRKRGAVLAIVTATAGLWLASCPVVSGALQGSLERWYPVVPVTDSPSADVIVVLGGNLAAPRPPRMEIELVDASDRLLHAARLYRAGKAPVVLAAGGTIPWMSSGPPESNLAVALLAEWQVPRAAIIPETRSLTTYQNAVQTKQILRERGVKSVLLVTSAMHMPRALGTFRAAGIDAIPSPTDVGVTERAQLTILSFLPDAQALEATTRAIKEYLGMAVYRWRGWM